jgi:hypothetical protein
MQEKKMITRTILALAIAIGSIGGALAQTRQSHFTTRDNGFEVGHTYNSGPALRAYGPEDTRDQHNDR